MAGMWKSDEASPGEDLAGLVKEIVDTRGSGVKRRRTKLSRSGVALAVAVVLALLAAPVAWFFWPRTVEIPDGMVGRWTTTVPEYADRAFTIAKDSVTFLTSPTDSTIHPITFVRPIRIEAGTALTISYASFGSDMEFSVAYTAGVEPTIEFINQRGMIWRKGR